MASLVALAVLVLTLAVAGVLIIRRIRIGLLEAESLAGKTAFGHPRSALEWPECRVAGIVGSPGDGSMLVVVEWPAHPERRAALLVSGDPSALDAIRRWQAMDAHLLVEPGRPVVLHRRNTLSRVHVEVVAEDDLSVPR
jgi:hypothetical protein